MEPIAAQQGISPSLRPTLSLTGDLAAVLQHGRVVAGEVMQKLDGGSLLLGVGRHRVAAQAGVELPVGKRFLARVEKSDGGATVLRLLGAEGAGTGDKLASALRGVVGQDRPVGDLLKGLATSLRNASREAGGAGLARVAGQVESHVFQPGSSGVELQSLIARAGFHYEAALLAYALKGSAGITTGEELQALAKKLAAEAALASSQVQGPLEPAAISALGERVQRQLFAYLRAKRTRGQGRAALTSSLESVLFGAVGKSGGDAVREALAKLVANSDLLEALAREDAGLSNNLKAQLLAALDEAPQGAAREALERALAGMESEQLMNVARRESQDAWHLSIPVPDGERWATAHLFYHEDAAEEGDAGEAMRRLTLAVDFSRLGPLRAELGIRTEDLTLAIVTSSEEVATRLRADLEGLTASLARDGRVVRASVRCDDPAEVAAGPLVRDVRWLRENHLLDCEG